MYAVPANDPERINTAAPLDVAWTKLILALANEPDKALLIEPVKLATVLLADEPVLKKYTLPTTSSVCIGLPWAINL